MPVSGVAVPSAMLRSAAAGGFPRQVLRQGDIGAHLRLHIRDTALHGLREFGGGDLVGVQEGAGLVDGEVKSLHYSSSTVRT